MDVCPQMTASNTRDSWLVTWLRKSVLGLWLRENPLAMLLIDIVLQVVLLLLLLWLLDGLQLYLACFLIALLEWIFRETKKRLVTLAWAQWRGHRNRMEQ